jgi:hypothetical protein
MPPRIAPGILFLIIGLSLGALAMPSAVAACSCVAPADIIDTAGRDPGAAVFTATALPRVGNDIPVVVRRWIAGAPPIGAVVLRGTPPDDMCGSTSPPPGGEYLFVTYQSEAARFTINGCSVQADVASPEGRVLLARAIGRFGPGFAPVPEPPPTTDPPALRPAADIGSIAAGIVGAVGPLVLIVAFGAGLVIGLIGVLKRTRFGRD